MKAKRILGVSMGFGVVVALMLAVWFGFNLTGGDKTDSSMALGTLDPSASSEGFKVHGHWTIEVRNSDGSLASRQEFDNALQTSGKNVLIQTLGRLRTIGRWQVFLESAGGVDPCLDADGTPVTSCRIAESTDPSTNNFVFKTLTVTVDPPPPIPDKLLLSGSANPHRDGSIRRVRVIVETCPTIRSSQDCASNLSNQVWVLTSTTLPSPIEVLAGQQVLATVVISFS